MDKSFPLIPADLFQKLDEIIKDRCPSMDWSDRKVWFEAGRRSVIDLLKSKYQDQLRNSLPKT